MPAEVVGTAFVRIRALTKGLSKDIEKAVTKAVNDADFSKVAEKFGKQFSASASEEINSGLKEGVEKVDIDGEKPGKKLGKSFADGAGKELNERLSQTIEGGNLNPALTRVGKEMGTKLSKSFTDEFALQVNNEKLDKRFARTFARNTADDFKSLFAQEIEKAGGNNLSRVFSRAFDKITPDLKKKTGAAGQSVGKSFGDRFVQHLKVGLARLIPILTPTIATIVSFVTQYVVALGAQIALLLQATAGGAVALGVAAAAVGTAIVPLIAAFKVKSAELDRFKAAGEAVGKAWREFGLSTQETLLPSLTRSLSMTKRLIPVFSDYGETIGEIVGRNAELFAGIVTGEEGQRRFAAIFEGSAPIVEDFMAIVIDLGDIISNVFIEALPVAQQFSDILVEMFDRWKDLIQVGADDGTLGATFQDWFDKSKLVFGALGDITVAIGNIISVGGTSAVPFFQNFADFADRFRTFTETDVGQNKIKQVFDDSLEVAHAFNDLIIEIGERIGGGIFEAGGNEGLIAFLDTLRTEVVPFLDEALRPLIENLGPQLTEFFIAFADVLTSLGEAGAIEVTVGALTLFTEAMTALLEIPGMDRLAGIILGIAGAFTVLKLVGITGIASSIGSLVLALGGFASIGALGTAISAAFASVPGIFAGIGAVVTGVLAPFALVIAIIAAVVAAVVLLVIHWDKVKDAFNATTRFFKDPEKRLIALRENIENLVGAIRDGLLRGLANAGRALGGFAIIIREKVEDAIGAVLEFLTRLPGMAVAALAGLGTALVELIIGALAQVGQALPGALSAIAGFFVTLPLRIIEALSNLALELLNLFISAHIAVGVWIVQTGIPTIIDFFKQIPGLIVGALAGLADLLLGLFVEALSGVINFITTNGPKVLEFFRTLPGKVADFLTDLPGNVLDAFSTAFDAVTRAIYIFITVTLPGFASSMLTAGSNLISKLVEGLGKAISGTSDIAKDIVNGIIGFINTEIIDRVNDLLEFDLGGRFGVPKVHVSGPNIGHIDELAMGGIFDRPTFAEIGEAGREVVIPLTNPRRALELVEQSGLMDVLARARPSSSISDSQAVPAGGGLIINHLEVKAEDVTTAWRETHTEVRALARGRFR